LEAWPPRGSRPAPPLMPAGAFDILRSSMDEHTIELARSAAERVFSDGRILVAYAFGSRVSGRPAAGSDLDVGYYLYGHRTGEALPLGEEMRLADELSALVGCDVDLRNLAEAPLDFRGRILEEGVRIFSGNDAQRVALERELLGRYHDYKEEFLRMHEMRLRRVAARGL
jgi:predicted nucleotidyltransferase